MKYFFLLHFIFLINSLILSQDKILTDTAGVIVESEFSVAINPIDSNNIVLVTMHYGETDDAIKIYYTNNFGETWQISTFVGRYNNHIAAGDPVLSFDELGNLYLINLAANIQNGVSAILSKSEDGGATWSLANTISTNLPDKPWMVIDNISNSPSRGNIYIPLITSSPQLFVLNDTAEITHQMAISEGDHLPSCVVKKNGDLFVSTVGIGNPNEIFVHQYTNGGTTLVHSKMVTSFPDYTFNAPDISLRFQPTVYMAIDNSGGPYDGRVYLSYTASERGNSPYFDVFLTYSDDDGVSWSTPKAVHSDTTLSEQQFYSSLFVNTEGVLLIDWYDRRNFDNSNNMTDFYLGVSYDGGNSFNETQLNTLPMDFDSMITAPFNSEFCVGEYHQLVATENTAISFWADGRNNNGDIYIYMSKVNINNPSTGFIETAVLSEKIVVSNLYPQPISNHINFNIELKEKYKLKSEILDLKGRILWRTNWINYAHGTHKITLPCNNISAGEYLLKITSDKGYFKVKKFIKH